MSALVALAGIVAARNAEANHRHVGRRRKHRHPGNLGATRCDNIQPYADLSYCDLRTTDLRWANLSHANLSYADVSGNVNVASAKLDSTNMTGLKGTGTVFTYSDMSKANIQHADLTKANLQGVKLKAADMSYANLTQVRMDGATCTGAYLYRANFSQAKATMAKFDQAYGYYVNMSRMDLSDSNLDTLSIVSSDLTDANLYHGTGKPVFTACTFCHTTMPDGTINDSNCPPV